MLRLETFLSPQVQPYWVLADDLTGAADAGVAFARAGLRTRAFSYAAFTVDPLGVEVAVFNTGSRNLAPSDAAGAVRGALLALQRTPGTLVYKKVDSTLRGSLGAESEAALAASDRRLAVICPAFPAMGRTLVDGVLRVDGVEVAQTPAGYDPLAPVLQSHLPTLLAGQCHLPIHHVPLADAALDGAALRRQVERLAAFGGLLVCDAATDVHLAAIANACAPLRERVLLVGSAGLAYPWAQALRSTRRRSILVVNGSLHPRARAQVLRLQATPGLAAAVELDPAVLHTQSPAWSEWLETTLFALDPARRRQDAVLLSTPPTDKPVDAGHASLMAHSLGHLARRVTRLQPFTGAVVVGGETLSAVLESWDAQGLNLHDELQPGIVIGSAARGYLSGLPVVTKAGGFGDDDLLLRIIRHLQDPPVAHDRVSQATGSTGQGEQGRVHE